MLTPMGTQLQPTLTARQLLVWWPLLGKQLPSVGRNGGFDQDHCSATAAGRRRPQQGLRPQPQRLSGNHSKGYDHDYGATYAAAEEACRPHDIGRQVQIWMTRPSGLCFGVFAFGLGFPILV